jgi:hypothetical protein
MTKDKEGQYISDAITCLKRNDLKGAATHFHKAHKIKIEADGTLSPVIITDEIVVNILVFGGAEEAYMSHKDDLVDKQIAFLSCHMSRIRDAHDRNHVIAEDAILTTATGSDGDTRYLIAEVYEIIDSKIIWKDDHKRGEFASIKKMNEKFQQIADDPTMPGIDW